LKIYKPLLVFLLTVMLASFAGGCAAASINAHAPLISSLVAEHTTLYPLGNTVVICSASSPDGAQQRTIVLAVDRNTKVMEPVTRDAAD